MSNEFICIIKPDNTSVWVAIPLGQNQSRLEPHAEPTDDKFQNWIGGNPWI